MKKILITTPLVMVSVAVLAQGTVTFDNRTSTLSSPPDRLVRYDPVTVGIDPTYNPFGSNSAPVVNFNTVGGYKAALYYGASTDSEGSLVAVTEAPANFRLSTTANPGTWGQGTRVLGSFVGGNTVNLQVRVWDSTFGATYEDWLLSGLGLGGVSSVFQYTIPSGSTPAPPEFFMSNFQGFNIHPIPEPATVALAGLGAAALLIFRRRK